MKHSKVLALVLTLIMALTASAFATDVEAALTHITIKAGDEVLFDRAVENLPATDPGYQASRMLFAQLTESTRELKEVSVSIETTGGPVLIDETPVESTEFTLALDNTSGTGMKYAMKVGSQEYTVLLANYVDPDNPYESIFPGLHQRVVTLSDGTERNLLIYVPEGSVPSAGPGVLVIPDSGITAMQAYETSGWKEFADTQERKPMILFAEAKDGGVWNTTEEYGLKGGDVEYLDLLYGKSGLSGNNDLFLISEARSYVFGYGDGGTMAHMAAMVNPIECTALVTVGGSNVTDAYMEAAAQTEATNLGNFTIEDSGWRISQFPVPVWIIDDPSVENSANPAVLEYWKTVNGTDAEAVEGTMGRDAYIRSADPVNPINQDKTAYTVFHSAKSGASANLSAIYDDAYNGFLATIMKWYGDPGGDLGIWHDYEDLGFKRYEGYIDGLLRNWYVYVPQIVKDSGLTAPVVYCCAGNQTQGDVFSNCTQFCKLADTEGFIVVTPSQYPIYSGQTAANYSSWNSSAANWYRPDDVSFIAQLTEIINEQFPVDTSRQYLMGLSNGSMLANLIFARRPDLFTSITATAGTMTFDDVYLSQESIVNRPDTECAILSLNGEFDLGYWIYAPEADNNTGKAIQNYVRMNGMEEPEDWAAYFADLDWTTTDRDVSDGHTFTSIAFEKNGMPIVQYAGMQFFPHTYMYEETIYMWEYMSQFVRNADGSLNFTAN